MAFILQNIYISNKRWSFELSIYQWKFAWKYSAQLYSTIRSVSWSPYQHIRMISEGSCDTENWSNDAEYSALHLHCIKLHFIY